MCQSKEVRRYLPHLIDDVIARCRIACILGDLTNPDGIIRERREWERRDFESRLDKDFWSERD